MQTHLRTHFRTLAIVGFLAASVFCFSYNPVDAATFSIGNPPAGEDKKFVSSAALHTQGTVVFTMNFSLTAFGADVHIPLSLRREPDTEGIGYAFKNRAGEIIDSGYAAGIIIPHTSNTVDGLHQIPEGDEHEFTIIMAFTDIPEMDREDRLVLTRLPMFLDEKRTRIEMTAAELGNFKTDLISLEDGK